MVSAPPASRNLGLGWLTSAGDWVHPALTWSYDGQGNLLTEATGGTTTSTYGYATSGNTVNELTSLAVSGQATRYYAYDKYGNPLSIGPSPTNPCPSSTSTCLGYDAQARLASVTEANNGPTIAMTYNAMGLRAGYTVTPYGASQPSLNEQFTYRGGQLAQTVTISGTTTYTDTYVYSQHGMPLELLRTTNGVLNRYWYERDGLGNVVALTDSNGNVVDQYAYDLWGKPTTVSESVPQQLRYQGYWYDTELGWYWLTSRAYDPASKRFLQPDPSELDGLFSYVYVGDDPVDGSDPSGFGGCWYHGLLPDGICPPVPGRSAGGGTVATSPVVVLTSGSAPTLGAYADNGGGNDLPIGGGSGGGGGGGGGGPEGGAGGEGGEGSGNAGSGNNQPQSGSSSSEALPATVKYFGRGEYQAFFGEDGYSWVRFIVEGDTVQVTDIFRGGQPPGTGGQMLASALQQAGIPEPSEIDVGYILPTQPTQWQLTSGVPAGDTVLGNTVRNAVSILRGNITAWRVYGYVDRLHIVATVSYGSP